MGARNGQDYLNRLREREREVWLQGEKVSDVTRHPGLRNGARAIAALYDMQQDPARRDDMTYLSPEQRRSRLGLLLHHPADPAKSWSGGG